jgi:ubiquinone/menaquinone biosynthesis C-methylase UbiE
MNSDALRDLYRRRNADDTQFRSAMWAVLCREFFQKWVAPGTTIVELGAGYCDFINNIAAARKIAVDLSPDTIAHAGKDVQVITTASTDLSVIPDGSAGVVFASNFFEHLTRADILATLAEAKRVLAPDGRMMILQPNIRFCGPDYWMFFDHITPLDDRSLVEALETTGFTPETVIPRFLPFTMKSRLPKSVALVRLYLAIPLLWRIFGAQSFIAARPVGS